MPPCKTCNTKGSVKCQMCKGTGKYHPSDWSGRLETCIQCGGSGILPCPVCGGSGQVRGNV